MIDLQAVPGLEEELKKVNEHIERFCTSETESMQKVMDWVLKARGKQIRPILTILCSGLKGKKVDVSEVAAVVEICHTASLIHDDIIDDADMRRGELSVHKKFGKEMAVYAGDFMIFSMIRKTRLMNKPWYKDMFEKLEIMCEGEVTQYDCQYNTEVTEERYNKNIIGKTSAMFAMACVSGAHEGKCNDKECQAVDRFAENFGLLFQVRDDYMDFVSTLNKSKKTIHNDFWFGYYTLPALYTFKNPEVGGRLKEIARELKEGKKTDSIDQEITELITKAGGFQYTLDKIQEYAAKAKDALSCFGDTVEKQQLFRLVDYLVDSVM